MPQQQHIVILGGGTAGWMTAAALVRFLPQSQYQISLIESEQIGTVGVGEATIPHIRQFNQWIGLDEHDFMQATGATYKLAIRFQGWGTVHSDYYHPFGLSGEELNGLPFHQLWLWLQQQVPLQPFDHYSLAVQLAQQKRFRFPSTDLTDAASAFNYAYQLDAGRYAMLLRQHATAQGVSRVEGKVIQVSQHPNGDLSQVMLEQGRCISGDLFIDCSGFSALLIEQTLHTGFENWQQWLPCDSALAISTPADPEPAPYTLAQATAAGWRWRIPLQHRTGNGLVYPSAFCSDEQAQHTLLAALADDELSDSSASFKALKFCAGRRKQSWRRNCVAIGLAAGFLEPLESTSLYFIQLALEKLLLYFPSSPGADIERENFNRQMETEYLRVRDFLILHYKLNQRAEPFWRECAQLTMPDSLQHRLALFQESGHILAYRQGLFQPASWLAVLLGQGVRPKQHDLRLRSQTAAPYIRWLSQHQQQLQQIVQLSPSHLQALLTRPLPHQAPPVASLYGYRASACVSELLCQR